MLQIVMLHEGDNAKILEVKEVDTLETSFDVLCSFDENLGQTVLEPLQNYVGELVSVNHFNRINDSTMYDYEQVRVLQKVDKDEKGFWYFETASIN